MPPTRSSTPSRRMRTVSEVSAGGLVVDRAGPVPQGALIGRFDRRGRLLWSLPKGHLETGESPEEAAVREVEEETGIRGHVVAKLGVIDFWFVAGGQRVHKTVHHFLLEAESGQLSDADIEVDEVAWVPLPELRDRLAYETERKLLATVPEQLGLPGLAGAGVAGEAVPPPARRPGKAPGESSRGGATRPDTL